MTEPFEKQFLVVRSPRAASSGRMAFVRIVNARSRAHALRLARELDPEHFAHDERNYTAPVAWFLAADVTYRV